MPLAACFIVSGIACFDSEKPKQANADLNRITSPQVVPGQVVTGWTGESGCNRLDHLWLRIVSTAS